jgi:hypothetical protein
MNTGANYARVEDFCLLCRLSAGESPAPPTWTKWCRDESTLGLFYFVTCPSCSELIVTGAVPAVAYLTAEKDRLVHQGSELTLEVLQKTHRADAAERSNAHPYRLIQAAITMLQHVPPVNLQAPPSPHSTGASTKEVLDLLSSARATLPDHTR